MDDKILDMFGKLRPLLEDPEITEIMVNGTKTILIEHGDVVSKADIEFSSEEEIAEISSKIFKHFNRRLDESYPYGDVCLDDGTRINAVLPSLVLQGTSVTIRKFSKKINKLDDLVSRGTLSQKVMDFLIACIKLKLNMLISGGTGVGKTTLLKLLSDYIPQNERVICIEDAPELYLNHPNVLNMHTRQPNEKGFGEVTLRDLIRNSLRMRPDRIIVGEIRGEEALDILQAMSTGHRGTLTIMHGSSPSQVISRLSTLIKFSGLDIATKEVNKVITNNISIIINLAQMKDGSRKITHISESMGLDHEDVMLQDIFVFKETGTDPDGKVQGHLVSSFRNYPSFFQEMMNQKLVTEDVFKL